MRRGFVRLLAVIVAATGISLHAGATLRADAGDGRSNVLFVLDVSGSMAGKIGDETKMAAAKRVFADMLGQLPGDTYVGLQAYGHRGNRDCSVIEMIAPVATLDAPAITEKVAALGPSKGATPIAAALQMAGDVVGDLEGARSIVLISDGKETCEGDPSAAAKAVREATGADVRIHVVGFGVDEETRRQLTQVADAGGGKYYGAGSADELASSFAAIKQQVAQAAEPEVIFEDEFEGAEMKDAWEVTEHDPAYLAQMDGTLYVISTPGRVADGDGANVAVYRGELPANYIVHLKGRTQITDFHPKARQRIGLVLFQDKDNLMELIIEGTCCGNKVRSGFWKRQRGEWVPGHTHVLVHDAYTEPFDFEFKVTKKGFKYTAEVKDLNGDWQSLGSHAMLGAKLAPAIDAYRGRGAEVINEIDSFRILSVE